MKNAFVTAKVEGGKLNALVKILMRQMNVADPNEAIRLINSGEWIAKKSMRRWREEDDVIYFSVTSDGTTGFQWIKRFEGKGYKLDNYVKSVLCSDDFKPTDKLKTEIAIFRAEIFSDDNRITKNIWAEAECRNWTKPGAEVACLIRDMFTDEELEEMGFLWVIPMHEPIKNFAGDPSLLSVRRFGAGGGLGVLYCKPDSRWESVNNGFVFVVSSSVEGLVL